MFKPLEMNDSRLASNVDIIKRCASGHVSRDGRDTNAAEFHVQIPFSVFAVILSNCSNCYDLGSMMSSVTEIPLSEQ